MSHTLSVEEVGYWYRVVVAFVFAKTSVSEHLLDVLLRTNTHVFLAKSFDMVADVGILQLFGERDLLELRSIYFS